MAGIEIKATGITSTAQVGDGVIVTADIADGAATAAKIGADVGFSSLPAENISDEPVNGQIAKYNFATGKWENSSSLAVTLTVRSLAKAAMDEIVLAEGELAYVTDTKEVRVGDEAETAGGIAVDTVISGTRVLGVNAGGSAIENAVSLRAVYAIAKTMTPLVTDRVLILLPPGKYDFVLGDVDDLNHGLELDTEFIDLEGMTGNPEDVILTSAIATASRGTVEQTADDVKLRGFTMEITSASSDGSNATEASAYFPDTALANAELTDIECKSTNSGVNSMRTHIEYAGTTVGGNTGGYTRVTGGTYSFGGANGTASGIFTNCTGGSDSFGSGGGTASGIFTNCTGGDNSFGSYYGTASGIFTDCTGGDQSFGYNGTASGIFTNCTGGDISFGGGGGTASGIFIDCTGGSDAFGNYGPIDAEAVFIRCHGAGVGSHMYDGTARDCYDDSWDRFDNTPPDAITVTSAGVAASLTTPTTEVTTNDDNDLDNVTLGTGASGQIKHIYCVASFAGDTWKITPAKMLGGTQITFGDNSVGTGCTLVYADNEGWIVIGNNGGTIA